MQHRVSVTSSYGNCARLGYYAASSGNSVPTFRDRDTVSKRRYGTTATHRVITQKSAILSIEFILPSSRLEKCLVSDHRQVTCIQNYFIVAFWPSHANTKCLPYDISMKFHNMTYLASFLLTLKP